MSIGIRISRPVVLNISKENNNETRSETSCVNRRIIGYESVQISVYEKDEFLSSIGSSTRMMIAQGENCRALVQGMIDTCIQKNLVF